MITHTLSTVMNIATCSAVKEKGNKENNNLLFHCNGTVIALGSAKPIIHT